MDGITFADGGTPSRAIAARIAFAIALRQRARRAGAENTCIPETHRLSTARCRAP